MSSESQHFTEHVTDLVDDLAHGVLDERQAAIVRVHCQRCPDCAAALDAAERRLAALRSAGDRPAEPSEFLIAATMQRVRQQSTSQPWTRRRAASWVGAALAACIVVAAAVHGYIATMKPSPYDLNVLWQDELWAGSDASLRARIVRRDTGAAIERAKVRIELREGEGAKNWMQLAAFETDTTGGGSPRMRLPDWSPGRYEMRVIAATPGGGDDEVLHRTVHLKRAWRLMLSSDKPVYQPGQTIRLRSLALRKPTLKPVAGEAVVFTVADPKGNVIFKQQGVTSAYGISSADCALDAEVADGAYAIECKVGDTTSKLTADVRRYVLPKFRVDVQFDKPYYQPGDTVRGTLRADYFFGKPVAGAAVSLVPHGVTGTLDPISLTTGPDGSTPFAIHLPDKLTRTIGDPFDDRMTLDVTARDTAGQELRRTASTVVTAQPLLIDVIPDGGALLRGQQCPVYVLVRYADGRPAKVRLAISGWPTEVETNELGAASISFKPAGAEARLTVRATDPAGLVAQRIVSLTCEPDGRAFAVRTDKAVYDAGATMTLTAVASDGYGGPEPVLVDLLRDDQTMLTTTVMPGTPLALDLPPEVYGTIRLNAYRFNTEGAPLRKSQVIYVRPPQGVTVSAKLDQAEYRPGGRARLSVALADASGKPVTGAVSLSAVDEAVFSVLDAAPGMERSFFTLERELLKPVYAIYHDWSPDKADAGGAEAARRLLEKAVFARTAKVDGGDDEAARLLAEEGISPDVLDVLNRPDVERILDNVQIQDPYRSRILAMRGDRAVFASTFPEKAARVAAARARGEATMTTVWIVIAVAAGVLLLVLLERMMRIVLALLAVAFFGSIMLPSLNRAREQATAVKAAADLRTLGQAMQFQSAQPRSAVPPTGAPPRLRQWFPETLLWRPELITDDAGRASLDIDLADSITTWRLTASAVTADGRMGATRAGVRVFQPFFVDFDLPVALVRGDEVTVPVAVYNYLDRPQTVGLSLNRGPWFDLISGNPTATLTLAKGEVRSVAYRIRANKIGLHALTVTAKGDANVGDAVKRDVEVVPDARRIDAVWNGTLQQPAKLRLAVPADAIDGSAKAFLKIYPSSFSQLVEGLDAIFQMPNGCFEQTSSTTYPNVLALDYLRRTNKGVPEVEARARQYIHLGYQRLLGFEIAGGGFDWFGRPPANRVLTAYGLMEFQDMARVHPVDPRLIERTRNWLLSVRNGDGSWSPEGHAMHDDPTGGGDDQLGTTAYVAWAVFSGGAMRDQGPTRAFLLSRRPAEIGDPYTLAMVCNALLEIDKEAAAPYVERLDAIKRRSPDGKACWWERPAGRRTVFYGAGESSAVEATSLAALAMVKQGGHAATARGALSWIVGQKDARGTWHSTQATVLALRALLAGTGAPLGAGQPRRIEITVDGQSQALVIPADQEEVMKQIDLSPYRKPGAAATVELRETSGTGVGYQVSFRHNVPGPAANATADEPLTIDLKFDRSEATVGQSIGATATVTNRGTAEIPMVLATLPVPAGFTADGESVEALRRAAGVDKVQVTPRGLVVYVRSLAPGQALELRYAITAAAPASVTVPGAEAYEYYDPARRAATPQRKLVALPGA